jgi:hypothetical protein
MSIKRENADPIPETENKPRNRKFHSISLIFVILLILAVIGVSNVRGDAGEEAVYLVTQRRAQ